PEMRDIIKKIPKLRGHGKNRSRTVRHRESYVAINLAALESHFNAGDTVTAAELYRKGLVTARGGKVARVKILGTGSLTKNL
ncbi:uL15 family ribosomal protein, partial [Enterococcus gallinarum]|uniref:uL15 family ribosomal protein n=1 Tax=Enterococcus gallinarum TaxID=1353 RepID=UPI003D14CAA8